MTKPEATVQRMWQGGPQRWFAVGSTRLPEGKWLNYKSPALEGFAGSYVCDSCQRSVDGVYETGQGWVCGTCRSGRSSGTGAPQSDSEASGDPDGHLTIREASNRGANAAEVINPGEGEVLPPAAPRDREPHWLPPDAVTGAHGRDNAYIYNVPPLHVDAHIDTKGMTVTDAELLLTSFAKAFPPVNSNLKPKGRPDCPHCSGTGLCSGGFPLAVQCSLCTSLRPHCCSHASQLADKE